MSLGAFKGRWAGVSERQQLLASLALQRTEDENKEVVACVLEQEALWSSEKVPAQAAVAALLGVFQRWLPRPQGHAVEDFFELFRPLGQALQAAAWLRQRRLGAAEQKSLDGPLVPLMVLGLLGLESCQDEVLLRFLADLHLRS